MLKFIICVILAIYQNLLAHHAAKYQEWQN